MPRQHDASHAQPGSGTATGILDAGGGQRHDHRHCLPATDDLRPPARTVDGPGRNHDRDSGRPRHYGGTSANRVTLSRHGLRHVRRRHAAAATVTFSQRQHHAGTATAASSGTATLSTSASAVGSDVDHGHTTAAMRPSIRSRSISGRLRHHHHRRRQRHAEATAATAVRPPPPNWTSPDGVAVDAAGDLFIADTATT